MYSLCTVNNQLLIVANILYAGTVRITDLDKLNLVKIGNV